MIKPLGDPDPQRVIDAGKKRHSATIAADAFIVSDAVAFELPPLTDIAVGLYLPGEVLLSLGITGRYARQKNDISPPGNFTNTNAAVMPVCSIIGE